MNFEEYESADFALQCKIKGFTTKIIFVKNFYFSLRKIEKYSFVKIFYRLLQNWETKWKTDCFHKFERKKIKENFIFIGKSVQNHISFEYTIQLNCVNHCKNIVEWTNKNGMK